MPGRTLPARRGGARRAASPTRRRCGCATTMPALHRRGAPADEVARAVFDAAEQARVEALGARGMAGVRANLARLTEMRLRTDPLVRARNREEVPLASAIGLIVRERLTGEAPPEAARAGLELRRRLDRGESRRRSRRARPRARRPGRLRRARHQAAARPRAGRGRAEDGNADPEEGDEGEGDDEAEGGDDDEQDEDDEAAAAARPRCGASSDERGEEDGESDWSEEEMAEADDGLGEEGEEGMLPVRPNRPLPICRRSFDYRIFTTHYDEVIDARELVRRGGAGPAARLSRPAARPSAGRGHQARQPAAAAADGAAVAQLGFRPGGRAARCRAAGAGDRQSGPFAFLQGRARHRVPRHRRHPADRQFGLDARPADLDRRDQRRHPRPHARALRRQGRDTRLHHPRLEGRPEPREMAGRRPAAAIRAGSTTCGTSSTRRPTSRGGGRARTSA